MLLHVYTFCAFAILSVKCFAGGLVGEEAALYHMSSWGFWGLMCFALLRFAEDAIHSKRREGAVDHVGFRGAKVVGLGPSGVVRGQSVKSIQARCGRLIYAKLANVKNIVDSCAASLFREFDTEGILRDLRDDLEWSIKVWGQWSARELGQRAGVILAQVDEYAVSHLNGVGSAPLIGAFATRFTEVLHNAVGCQPIRMHARHKVIHNFGVIVGGVREEVGVWFTAGVKSIVEEVRGVVGVREGGIIDSHFREGQCIVPV
jgi:hypothetical protein